METNALSELGKLGGVDFKPIKGPDRSPRLQDVVRCGPANDWRMQLRIAESIIQKLGWPERLDVAVLRGEGEFAKILRIVPIDAIGAQLGARITLVRRNNHRASTVELPIHASGLQPPEQAITVPHEVTTLGTYNYLTVDLRELKTALPPAEPKIKGGK
jgi:hypothetical protein